jgi:glycolate oxidase
MLDASILKAMESVVGGGNILGARDIPARYFHDAAGWKSEPDAVVRPRNAEEAAGIVALAYENSIPVTPRGAGTGLYGGCVAASGGIVLCTERMNARPRFHKEDLYAEVEPGVVNGDFRKMAEAEGLFYPPDPASLGTCTIGGNIAECADGLRSHKYGTTRRYVLGLEVVTPEGRLLRMGARTVKSVAGYDITRLWVGSEGTLGFITSAVLRLLPLPQARTALAASFSDAGTALEAGAALVTDGLIPSMLEVMDAACRRAASAHIGKDIGEGALLFVEFEDMQSVCRESAERASRLLGDEYGAVVRGDISGAERARLLQGRRSVLPALWTLKPVVILEDLTVPRSKLKNMSAEIEKIAARNGIEIALFGHAGGGNIHPAFLGGAGDGDEMIRMRQAVAETAQACAEMDGSVSGMHGIGLDKAPYLKLEIGQSGYEVIKSLKASLDPRAIMNPGKLFYEERE